MRKERKRLFCKLSTVVGCVVVLLSNGVSMYWGNLSVYTSSYNVVYQQSTFGIEAPWVVSLFSLFWTLGIMAYESVKYWTGERWVAVLGCLSTEVGIFASYFSVQASLVLLNFTIAVLTGIGTGILHAHVLRLLVDWANNDVASLFSIMQGSFHWGAAIINQLVTLYLNPSNDKPNILIGHFTYFTQTEILDKVPSIFLVLGGFSVTSHFIGFCLLRDNVFDKSTNHSDNRTRREAASINSVYRVENSNTQDDATSSRNLNRSSSHSTGYGGSEIEEQRPPPSSVPPGRDYTPKEMLKSATFYALLVAFFFNEYPFLILVNYYKSFGQIWIHDDFFLTNLGTFMSVINVSMRIVLGVVMDKIGFRKCFSFQIFSVVLITAWFYFTAILNKWLYFFVTSIFSALSGVLFIGISVSAVSIFGKSHFSTNFGLLHTSSVALNLSCPFAVEAILNYLGWFYIFSFAAFANNISLFLILVYVPQV